MQSKYSLDSLNFAAFTEPNKHKTNSKDFSTTWPTLFSNIFTTVGEFKRLLQSFFSNRFSRHDGTVLLVPVTSTSARSSPLHLPHVLFDTTNLYKTLHRLVVFLARPKSPGVLTIYMGKPEIPVGKSNGSRHSIWEASENMGCDLR